MNLFVDQGINSFLKHTFPVTNDNIRLHLIQVSSNGYVGLMILL